MTDIELASKHFLEWEKLAGRIATDWQEGHKETLVKLLTKYEKRIAELEKAAQRYRVLRDRYTGPGAEAHWKGEKVPTPEAFDAAIDAGEQKSNDA